MGQCVLGREVFLMRVCGKWYGFAARFVVAGWVAAVAISVEAPSMLWGQAPQKKAPVPPQKTPVPPQKTTAPPQKTPAPPQKATAPPTTKGPTAPPNTRATKLPPPEDVVLDTKDGLKIKATYYPGATTGSDKGADKKQIVPLILVHGIDGQRGDFHGLAVYLQELGHASIAPDLRGHGQSKAQTGPTGKPITLEANVLNRGALESMVLDIEACKKFLLDKNNAGELNIEQLCVVGAEFGAILAVRWAAMDWEKPNLPAYKLGQDVKALVLLSPPPPFKTVQLRDKLPVVQSQLSILLVAGTDDPKSSKEADKLYQQLQKHHPRTGEDTDLFFEEPPTNLSGTELLTKTLNVRDRIGIFIEKRLVNRKAEFTWHDRKGPGT